MTTIISSVQIFVVSGRSEDYRASIETTNKFVVFLIAVAWMTSGIACILLEIIWDMQII